MVNNIIKQKLIIKNFAGIEEMELEVRPINILIGPQASGKSICAKLLFYFQNFSWETILSNYQTKREFDASYARTFEKYFPSNSWGESDFLVRYEIGDNFIEIKKKKGSKNKVFIKYSDYFNDRRKRRTENLHQNIQNIKDIKNIEDKIEDFLESLDTTMIQQKLSGIFNLFIPAGRSFFANLQNNIFTFLSTSNELDPFLINFGSLYENIKHLYLRSRQSESGEEPHIQNEINRLIENCLCGKYVRDKGGDFLEMRDGRRVNLANASSGQQEILPLVILLVALPRLFSRRIYIEEPEAHLFPSAQRSIVELIAISYQRDRQFCITTHSPYILTSINNLLQAGLMYEENNPEIIDELEKIVPKYKALHPSELSVYALENGRCRSIMCPDTGLIDAQVIDAVSDDLAIEFDQLLNLT
jgi:hypothetical protein